MYNYSTGLLESILNSEWLVKCTVNPEDTFSDIDKHLFSSAYYVGVPNETQAMVYRTFSCAKISPHNFSLISLLNSVLALSYCAVIAWLHYIW